MLAGDSLVMLEQSAEPLAATDVAKRENLGGGSLGLPGLQRTNEKFVFTPLMRPFCVVDRPSPLGGGAHASDLLQSCIVAAIALNSCEARKELLADTQTKL